MKYNELPAVMSDASTSMRDPIFYRWHKMVDDLCMKLKGLLPPYEKNELAFNGVKLVSCDLISDSDGKSTTELLTFWHKSTVDLQNGLNFSAKKACLLTFTHLNYQTFSYS